jgi:hypothetical protein
MSRKPVRIRVLQIVLSFFVVVTPILALALPVDAASMGCANTFTGSVSVNPGVSLTPAVFQGLGPTDKTWVVHVWFGIASGSTNQNTNFAFGLYDTGTLVKIAAWKEVANAWNDAPGNYNYENSLTSHSGSTADLYVTIHNWGTLTTTYIYRADTLCM